MYDQINTDSDLSDDQFKPLFKKFKSLKCNQHDFDLHCNQLIVNDTVDLVHDGDFNQVQTKFDVELLSDKKFDSIRNDINFDTKVLRLNNVIDGLFVVPSILTTSACDKWFNYAINELPNQRIDQLRANIDLETMCNLEDRTKSNLRWITFGLHHNWNTRVYDKVNCGQIPDQINLLMDALGTLLHPVLGQKFNVEAGIVNYYTCRSNLGAHVDDSEPNQHAPLFSLSLGQSMAVFLIGGHKKSDPVKPLLLRNGDLLIMTKDARKSYHSVPKVFCKDFTQQLTNHEDNCNSKQIVRININARQVN